MSSEDTTEHHSDTTPSAALTDYVYRCLVCGAIKSTAEEAEKCHQVFHSSVEEGPINSSKSSPDRFVCPYGVFVSFTDRISDKRSELKKMNSHERMRAGVDLFYNGTVSPDEEELKARLYQFISSIVLISVDFIPGYFQLDGHRTGQFDSKCPLQIFIDEFDVSREEKFERKIKNSDYIKRDRVYRTKRYSITSDLWNEIGVFSSYGPWDWTTPKSLSDVDVDKYQKNYLRTQTVPTYVGVLDTCVKPTSVFGDGTAHNIIVAETREWLATHSKFNWVCAPHAIEIPEEHIVGYHLDHIEAPIKPFWMFDFAGFNAEHQINLVGAVIDGEHPRTILDQVQKAKQLDLPLLVVFECRASIENALNRWIEDGRITEYVAPPSTQPSISAINRNVLKYTDFLGDVYFITRKQLVDRIISVDDIVGSLERC